MMMDAIVEEMNMLIIENYSKKKQDISQKSMQHLTQKRKNIQMVGIFLIMTKISFNFSLPM